MFRAILGLFGAAIAVCVGLYFFTRQARYLRLASRILLGGLAVGVVFFAALLIKRLI